MHRRIWLEVARLDVGLELSGRSLVSGPLIGHAWHRQATCIPAVLRSPAQPRTSPPPHHRYSINSPHFKDPWHVSTRQPGKAISSMATGAKDKSDPPAEAELSDQHILRELLVHLWPKDNPEFRTRVVGALGLLVGSKLLNIQVCPATTAARTAITDGVQAPASRPLKTPQATGTVRRCRSCSSTQWTPSPRLQQWTQQWLPLQRSQLLSPSSPPTAAPEEARRS